jgi:hypothetical protein
MTSHNKPVPTTPYSPGEGAPAHSVLTSHNTPVPTTPYSPRGGTKANRVLTCHTIPHQVEMTLLPSDYTKAMWPADFKATQTITLKDGALTAAMAVTNNGKEAFTFTGSFHTYFNAAIGEVKVGGLDGLKMTDRLASKDMTNKGDVSISGPVDACYYDAPKKLTLAVGSPARLLWHINAVGAAPPSG